MLTALSAVNSAGDKLDLPLGDSSSGYLVKGVSGLDPVKATFTTSTRANIPGSSFRSGTRESRNVVLSLELKPDFWNKTGESLLSRLYSFFNPGSKSPFRYSWMAFCLARSLGGPRRLKPTCLPRGPRPPSQSCASTQTLSGNPRRSVHFPQTQPLGESSLMKGLRLLDL